MAENWGLVGGIASGVREAMTAYQTVQNAKRQETMMGLLHGLEKNPETNEWQLTPQAKQLKQLELQKAQGQAQEYQPLSAESPYGRAIKGAAPQFETEGMSPHEIKQVMPLYEKQMGVEAAKANKEAMMGLMQKRQDLQQQKFGYTQDKEVRSKLDSDPILKTYIPRLEGAAKINELIEAANSGKVVSNQALLGQLNAEIARLETGSQSPGLHAAEKTELLSRSAQMKAFVDSFTGNPTDAVDPRILKTAKKMIDELSTSYMRGIDSRMDYLKQGMSESQKGIIDQKHESFKNTYKPRFEGRWSEGHDSGLIKPGSSEKPGLIKGGPMSEEEFIKKYIEAKKANK